MVHQIHNATQFVSYNDVKALMADLKTFFAAVDEQIGLYQLEVLRENGAKNIPKSPSPGARTGRENFNRQLRKVTKSQSVFPTDDSLLQMLYLVMMDLTKKWTDRRKDWGIIRSQVEIFFADRLECLTESAFHV